jgi:hypothetical protein
VKTQRTLLGFVEVDSGTLLVGDPAYCLPDVREGRAGIDFQAVLDAPSGHAHPLAERPVLLLGRFGGDGTFPVIGEFEDGELMRVIVEFVEPE